MKNKAYAKINLSLDVLAKKKNGYHIISTVFQMVDLYDEIEMKVQDKKEITINCNNKDVPCDENNLVYKACKFMLDSYGINCGVIVNINKNIPVAAGLAGGSSDCACALTLFSELFDLNVSKDKLAEYGQQFGADVSYCVLGGTMLGSNVGDKLESLQRMPDCYIVISKPDIMLSTKDVYEGLNLEPLNDEMINKVLSDTNGKNNPNNPMKKIIDGLEKNDINYISKNIYNKLEEVSVNKVPKILEIKKTMQDGGALNSMMSGSGPSVFGIFDNEEKAKTVKEVLINNLNIKQTYICKPI